MNKNCTNCKYSQKAGNLVWCEVYKIWQSEYGYCGYWLKKAKGETTS